MPKRSTEAFIRGQSARDPQPICKGMLTITLSGPAGCGKSLVAKVLKGILPLLPVDEVKILETNE